MTIKNEEIVEALIKMTEEGKLIWNEFDKDTCFDTVLNKSKIIITESGLIVFEEDEFNDAEFEITRISCTNFAKLWSLILKPNLDRIEAIKGNLVKSLGIKTKK